MVLTYHSPQRHIFDLADHSHFVHSPAYEELLKFIGAINAAVTDKSQSAPCAISEPCAALIAILEELGDWIDSIPPLQQPMRYGNKAFRQWHTRLVQNAQQLCERVLATTSHTAAAAELATYLCESFGNPIRIDYGTGHETTFIVFLLCLCKLGVFSPQDLPSLGLKVFPAYMKTIRKAQRTYWLEPAGSHGVWSLDDYQFLVFLFGSAQLAGHAHIKPRSIHSAEVVEGFSREYMYLAAVRFINEVKYGAPFAEHSPILNDISELPSWARVNEGLLKMYKAEVLGKLPVMQHMLFGSIFQASWTPSRPPVASEAGLAVSVEGAVGAPAPGAGAQQHRSFDSVPEDSSAAVAPWVSQPICPHGAGSRCACSGTVPPSSPQLLNRVTGGGEEAAPADSGSPHARLHGSEGIPAGSFPAGQGQSPVTSFLASFGPVPHMTPQQSQERDEQERESVASTVGSSSEGGESSNRQQQ